ncbi:hypothetical protein NBRGN_038_01230 [Nocardia brasiliensis NBRC 14402]|uniref:hypothetical protein n=1 Tax=Nocardia brasiliensis TaxID=37326 RepID=UPI00045C903F|nr:hypothetical protein [Nocardia brasiliensis]ASF08692.1 hypothetical protein CEQ30_16450 [Nocardia brasiliensis]GAJ81453.1 hypothetical protein NBRGN_038_01230 [Nocardia brasiliensis NBRC 14402]SUB40774.1 Uncharacterised protein [Nocardia brasiliensis]
MSLFTVRRGFTAAAIAGAAVAVTLTGPALAYAEATFVVHPGIMLAAGPGDPGMGQGGPGDPGMGEGGGPGNPGTGGSGEPGMGR